MVPPFITKSTCCSTVMSCSGSPRTATRSAYFPGAIEPTFCSVPSSVAPLSVPATIACIGVMSYFTISSNSRALLPWRDRERLGGDRRRQPAGGGERLDRDAGEQRGDEPGAVRLHQGDRFAVEDRAVLDRGDAGPHRRLDPRGAVGVGGDAALQQRRRLDDRPHLLLGVLLQAGRVRE